MSLSRRGFLEGASAAFVGFTLPGIDKIAAPAKKKDASLWVVFSVGDSRSPGGFKAFEKGKAQVEAAGFEVLDSIHNLLQHSRFLAHKRVSREYADEQEKLVLIGEPEAREKSDLLKIGDFVLIVAMWVERGPAT
jgi:hypothetical protein